MLIDVSPRSIKNSIKYNYTMNKNRAEKLLAVEMYETETDNDEEEKKKRAKSQTPSGMTLI